MADELQIDIILEGADPATVEQVRSTLAELGPTTLEPTRELITIISVASAAVALAQKLIDLWKSTRAARSESSGAADSKPSADTTAAKSAPGPAAAPNITIEVQSGATLILNQVTSAAEIERFVAAHASPAAG